MRGKPLGDMRFGVLKISRSSAIFVLLGLVGSLSFLLSPTPVSAATGINQQLNFQGRLLNTQGATVPDGYYNLEFKIYQGGTGTAAGNPGGTLKWTEDWLNNSGNGVQVKNGFLSVQLGSITPFGTSVNWNDDTLWISMNVGGIGATCTTFSGCTPDGEMLPMKRLSASPYALNSLNATNAANSAALNGKTDADFIQNQNVAAQTTSNFWISGTGKASSLQASTSVVTPALRSVADSTSALQIQNAAGTQTVMNFDTTNGRVGIGTTAPASALHVATNDASTNGAQVTIEQQGSGDATMALKTAAETWSIGVDASDASTLKFGTASTTNTYASLGNTAIGTADDGSDNNIINAAKYTTGASGTLTSLSVYIGCPVSAAPNNQFRLALYSSNSGGTAPQTLLTQNSGTLVTGWNMVSVPTTTVTSGTAYWIAFNTNGTAIANNCFRESTTGGTSVWSSAYTYAAMPASWPGTVSGSASNPSFYGRVLVAGANDNLGLPLLQLTTTGQAIFRNSTDTQSAFRVQNAGGTNVFTTDTLNGYVGIGSGASVPTATLQVAGSLTSAGGAINLNASSNFAVNIATGTSTGAVTIGNVTNAANSVVIAAGATAGITLQTDKVTIGNAMTNTTVQKASQTTTNAAGTSLAINGATGNGTGAGGAVNISGGNGGATNANGGNLNLSGGTATGTGANGLVVITTPTFSTTTNDPNCFTGGAVVTASCTLALSSVNGSAAILAGFSTDGQTATLPDPTIATPGRVIYVTAANGSKDFTLAVNGGGLGNQIAMRQNTTATMIWNGSDWTAAGASSSTTMQAAYDNTLQSAGGAELVVSKTAATNGLTIRDSATNPVNGTLLSIQTSSATTLFSVNSNVTEYAANSGAEVAGSTSTVFPTSTWAAVSGATVTRYTTVGDAIATGQASVSVSTPATAGSGAKDTLTGALTAGQHYNVSFAARLGSGTFTDLEVYYSADGTTASTSCLTGKAVPTSVWAKVNCSFTAPASGITASNAIIIRQSGANAHAFYVDNLSVTIAADYNYATDGGVYDAANFAANWSAVAGSTVARNTTYGQDNSDSAQATTTATGQGVRNKLSINPLPNTLYRVSIYVASSAAGFNSFTVRYSPNGGTSFIDCADYNTRAVSSSLTSFTQVTCYVKTDGTAASSPYIYFLQNDASARSFYVDVFSMTLTSKTTPNVQIGGGSNGGPVTLLTLDRAASAPIASNNEDFLGSMYYDTSLGKLQCYEADGWGACGSSPDSIVTISPEFTNAVLHGTGIGTMTSDICSATLNINDGTSGQPTICSTNETYNFYKWTSPQASAQSYSIYVTYQLPSTFKAFNSGQTSLMGRTDSTNANVSYQVYRNDSTGLNACGPVVQVSSGIQTAWQLGIATGAADPSTCGFTGGNSIVFKISVTASSNANSYVGNLNFSFSNR